MQRSMDPVLFTFCFILAVNYGRELLVRDVLECFGSANVAGVGIDEQQRFDFRHTCDDAADCDELAQVGTFDFSNGHGDIGT